MPLCEQTLKIQQKISVQRQLLFSYCGYDLSIGSERIAGTVEQILRCCEGCINKFCTRSVIDMYGCAHACLDEYMVI